jgi:hypothetical protein
MSAEDLTVALVVTIVALLPEFWRVVRGRS